MKLTTKNFIIMNGVIFLVVTATLFVLYIFMPIYYEQVKIKQSTSDFRKIVQTIKSLSQEEMIDHLKTYEKQNQQLYLYLTKGDTVIYPDFTMSSFNADSDSVEIAVTPNFTDTKMKTINEKITTDDGEILNLRAEYSLQPISDASYILLQIYPFILLIALLIGSISAYIYSRSSTKRIKALSKTTRDMVSLEAGLSCDIKGKDEIAELGQDINWMYCNLCQTVEELEEEIKKTAESERSKEEFLRITSHELKTPIASMMGIVDGMIFGVGNFKDRDYYLKECRRILEEQSQLVQSILDVSRLEMSNALQEDNWQWFSLSEMLEEKMVSYQLLADINHYQLSYSLEQTNIRANKDYLEKAIKNVIDNAFHYTRLQGSINIELKNKRLTIKNQPQHLLTETEIKQIFMPFYRPDYSRNRKEGGTGLGLFIVKSILERHQIEYHFGAVDETWMCFTMDLKNLC